MSAVAASTLTVAQQYKENLLERFLEKVDFSHPEGCWIWKSARNGKCYGRFLFNGKNMRAHRMSHLLFCGEIPLGQWVLHRCDQPLCVAPHHLFLGDSLTNVRDMMRKGRGRGQFKPGVVSGRPSPALIEYRLTRRAHIATATACAAIVALFALTLIGEILT